MPEERSPARRPNRPREYGSTLITPPGYRSVRGGVRRRLRTNAPDTLARMDRNRPGTRAEPRRRSVRKLCARPARRPRRGCPPPARRPTPGSPGCANRRCRARPARPRARRPAASSTASPITTTSARVDAVPSAARWRSIWAALPAVDGAGAAVDPHEVLGDAVRAHDRHQLRRAGRASTATGSARRPAGRPAAPRRPRPARSTRPARQ